MYDQMERNRNACRITRRVVEPASRGSPPFEVTSSIDGLAVWQDKAFAFGGTRLSSSSSLGGANPNPNPNPGGALTGQQVMLGYNITRV